jgi:non-heme chloroperoxidase
MIKDATLRTYKGAPHGLPTTHKDQVNMDLLAFAKGQAMGTLAA